MYFRKINDMHCHLREGEMFHTVIGPSTKNRENIVAMPNLKVPITNYEQWKAYDELTNQFASEACTVNTTLYFHEDLKLEDLKRMQGEGLFAVKMYPLMVTTHSGHGISFEQFIKPTIKMYDVLSYLELLELPLLIHPEMPGVSFLESEYMFLPFVSKLIKYFPKLKITLEHITDSRTVNFVSAHNVAATITAHHLYLTVDDVVGKPDNYCKPVAKRISDLQSLRMAATSGDPKFFLGSDSAPHEPRNKYSKCCAAGCYTAPILIELLLEFFQNDLDKFEGFTHTFAEKWYGLQCYDSFFEAEKKETVVKDNYNGIVPFKAGETLSWRLV